MVQKIEIGPLIDYARVSTQGQDLTQQRGSLREADCTRIFEAKVSVAKGDWPEPGRLFEHLRTATWRQSPALIG
ncbi:recombinase family protein [Paraburkholderia sediminicola]